MMKNVVNQIVYIVFALCALIAYGAADDSGGAADDSEYGIICRALDNNVFQISVGEGNVVVGKDFKTISVTLADGIEGKIRINNAESDGNIKTATLVSARQQGTMPPDGSKADGNEEDSSEEDSSEDEADKNGLITINIYPVISDEGARCDFIIPDGVPDGEWTLTIPAGMLEVEPGYVEVPEIDYPDDVKTSLGVYGAWHKKGDGWNGRPMFTIQDDDGIDGMIPSSFPARGPTGYYSLLYPILESLGLRGTCSMIGARIGFTDNPPALNDNGRIALRLQEEKGWEIQSHSMVCLGEELNNWSVDSLTSPLANRLFAEGNKTSQKLHQTTIYDCRTKKQYEISPDGSRWVESERRWIKPYIGNYDKKVAIAYNPDFSVDYHWGEWYRLAEKFGIRTKSWVTYNSSASHGNVPEIMKYAPYGFADMNDRHFNEPPLLSVATRFVLEGQNLNYAGENSRDNTYDKKQYKEFIGQIDKCFQRKGWIVFGIHAYRWCWINSLPGALVSEGGTYPDEWVEPMKGIDPLTDSLDPPTRLGISDWSEWYPCPGTRAYMAWEILKYARDKGMLNVTSTEGHELMGNTVMSGYYVDGCRIGQDIFNIEGTREEYPHYVKSVTGEESYYRPYESAKITVSFRIEGSVNHDSLHYRVVTPDGLIYRYDELKNMPKGIWIVNGKKIMVK